MEFTAIIDTGFSGFVSMPMIRAFPLGLVLSGTTGVTLADGQQQTKLMGLANATIDDQTTTAVGLVILEPSTTDLLIGMDFLRKFELALHITSEKIELYKEKEVTLALAAN